MTTKKVSTTNKIKQDRATKADFMGSINSKSSKGKANDPLTRQRPALGVELTDREITTLYKTNQIFQNIIEVPAEDATREWIEFAETDQALREQLEKKLKELKAQAIFKKFIGYERLRGAGYISIGTTETPLTATEPGQPAPYILDQPINLTGLQNVNYLQAFSKLKIAGYELNEDVFSLNFGKVEYYRLKALKNATDRKIHPDRIISLVTRETEDEITGIPLIQSLYDALLVFDNAAWSIGQLFYSLLLKVLQSPDVNLNDVAQDGTAAREALLRQLEWEFNSLTVALIGKDDTLQFASPAGALGSAMETMLGFVWDYLAGSARMPKAHILGQQQGTITGGQYDSLNHYARIAGFQENYLREPLEYLIRLLLLSSESGVGNGSIDPLTQKKPLYTLKFKPLWRLDAKTDAEIRKLVAETFKYYCVDMQAITPDEVRQVNFKLDPLGNVLEANPDVSTADLEKLNQEVTAAMNEANKNKSQGGNELEE